MYSNNYSMYREKNRCLCGKQKKSKREKNENTIMTKLPKRNVRKHFMLKASTQILYEMISNPF